MIEREQDVTFLENSAERRYEARAVGAVIGFCSYTREGGRIIFPHTEIDPGFEGRGIGGKLVAFALADARGRDLQVVPACSFVADYVARHPEAIQA